MANIRIKDQTTDTSLSTGDYVIVDSQSEGTRKFDLGTELTDIKEDLSDLQAEIEGGGSGSGMSAEFKQALHNILEKVAYIDEDGRDYLNALDSAMYPPVTAISLNTNSLSFATLNSTQQLTATTTPTGGAVTWSSSNTSVATVSSSGLVTSKGYGSATITATSGSVSASCSVSVTQATLSSISVVYTQSGTVYDTDSLDDLKTDLVVTAHWSNSTTSTVASTDYTLSGTLTEGTSTITVAYGGKTTTFNVTVTTFSTAIRIAKYDKTLNGSGSVVSTPGACYSEGYDYQIDVNALKNSSHYDSANNYMNTSSCIFKVKYVTTNPSSISYGSGGKLVCFDTSDVNIDYASAVRTGALSQWNDSRYTNGYFTLSNNTIRLKFSLDAAALDDSYAYFDDTIDHIMPVGVSVGDIIFAGANTPYYGKHNIND